MLPGVGVNLIDQNRMSVSLAKGVSRAQKLVL